MRGYIPKIFHSNPTLESYEDFLQLFAIKLIKLRLLPKENFQILMEFTLENRIYGENLFVNFQQHSINICKLIWEEIENPSSMGLNDFYQFPMIIGTSANKTHQMRESNKVRENLLSSSGLLFSSGSFNIINTDIIGWFTSFFEEIEIIDESIALESDRVLDLVELVHLFQEETGKKFHQLLSHPIKSNWKS